MKPLAAMLCLAACGTAPSGPLPLSWPDLAASETALAHATSATLCGYGAGGIDCLILTTGDTP